MQLRFTRMMTCSAGLALSLFAAPAAAQDSKGTPAPATPKSPGADTKEARPEVDELVKKVNDAFAPLTAVSYRAYCNAYPKDAQGKSLPVRKHVFDVQMTKAETGAWKFAITPADEQTPSPAPAAKDEPARAARIAYDSLTLRAQRDDQKAVFERTIKAADDCEPFLDEHGAAMTVIWDFLEKGSVLGNVGRATTVVLERDDTVEGEQCRVLRVMDMPGAFVPEAFKDETATRYKISRKDNVPRSIERLRPGKTPGSFDHSRGIVLTQWKTNADALAGDYNISVPDGYRVRASQRMNVAVNSDKAKTDASKPGPKKADDPSSAAPFAIAVGSAAPDFSLKTPEGGTKTLADYKGKLVLMDFWGTWCPPCRAAMPGVQNLHKKYKDKGLAVVGMNFEQSKAADPAKYMKDHGFDYELLLHAEQVADKYKIQGFPTFFLVDQSGKIVWSAIGYDPKHEQELDKLIGEKLASK